MSLTPSRWPGLVDPDRACPFPDAGMVPAKGPPAPSAPGEAPSPRAPGAGGAPGGHMAIDPTTWPWLMARLMEMFSLSELRRLVRWNDHLGAIIRRCPEGNPSPMEWFEAFTLHLQARLGEADGPEAARAFCDLIANARPHRGHDVREIRRRLGVS